MAAEVEGQNDVGFSEEKGEITLKDKKIESMKVSRADEKREKRLCFLLYRDFLLHTRSLAEDRATKDCSSTRCGAADENEKNHGLYADDEGYLVGEIYAQRENDEELGFEGELSNELNLIQSDKEGDIQRTFQDTEPEIVVVPSKRFVREITK